MKSFIGMAAFAAVIALSNPARAQLSCQLGILDLTASGGINPATGAAWKTGDKYHLLFVTKGTTIATSTDIATYNAFVQADAAAAPAPFTSMGNVAWRALGSTSTTNALVNAPITGPVMNAFNSATIALNSGDFWNYNFGSINKISDLSGADRNVWTGTGSGGTAANPLGGASVRRYWTGWNNWNTAVGNDPNTTSDRYMMGLSEELAVSGPDTSFPLTITPNAITPGSYDLEWASQEGKLYNLRTSIDLTGAIPTWTLVEGGIEATPPNNLRTVASTDDKRFYAVEEYDAPTL